MGFVQEQEILLKCNQIIDKQKQDLLDFGNVATQLVGIKTQLDNIHDENVFCLGKILQQFTEINAKLQQLLDYELPKPAVDFSAKITLD